MVPKTRLHKDVIWMALMMFIMISGVGYGVSQLTAPGYEAVVIAMTLGLVLFYTWALIVPLLYQSVGAQWRVANEECDILVTTKDAHIRGILNQIDVTKAQFLTQEIIDKRLRELAASVEELFNVQIQLREDEDEGQLSSIRGDIAKAKEVFWLAHNLANALGFAVKPKIKDYTTNW